MLKNQVADLKLRGKLEPNRAYQNANRLFALLAIKATSIFGETSHFKDKFCVRQK